MPSEKLKPPSLAGSDIVVSGAAPFGAELIPGALCLQITMYIPQYALQVFNSAEDGFLLTW